MSPPPEQSTGSAGDDDRAAEAKKRETKPCRHCQTEMPRSAKFCTTCELFQYPVLHAKSSSIYVTAMSTGITALLLAVTFVSDWRKEKSAVAEPRVIGVRCYKDAAYITLANLGRRPMALSTGHVTGQGLDEEGDDNGSWSTPKRDLDFVFGSSDNKSSSPDGKQLNTVFKEMEARTVQAVFVDSDGINTEFQSPPKSKVCQYVISISYMAFDNIGKKDLPDFQCACSDIFSKNRSGEADSTEVTPGGNADPR
ncbi:MAG: hypothetical protein ABIT04_10120 [Novosphingobium sp.]